MSAAETRTTEVRTAGDARGPAGATRTIDPGSVTDRARHHVRAIRGGIAALAQLALERLSADDTLALAREVEAAARALYGTQVRLAMEVDERGLAAMCDVRSAAHLLHQTLNITVGEARARLEAGRVGLGRETITGETIDATMPALIDAVDAGAVSSGHACVITRCLSKIPRGVDAETVETCRRTLLDQARIRDVNGLQKVADQILAIVTADGDLPEPPEDRAELYIGARRGDGLTPIRGMLSPLVAEQLRVAIEALATPHPIDRNTPDPRPAPLRRAQALGEILHRHLTSGAGPRDGGVRPQVVVTISLQDLFPGNTAAAGGPGTPEAGAGGAHGIMAGGGAAWSDYDGPQSAGLARLLACDAQIIPQVLGGESAVLDQGHAERLFTPAQRRALTTRDKGCAFPGCDIPPAWCEIHHVAWWIRDDGPTDLDNGVLLCRRHHSVIHQGRWRIEPAATSRGRPWFVPPPHIDPEQRPRQNCHFHLPLPRAAEQRE